MHVTCAKGQVSDISWLKYLECQSYSSTLGSVLNPTHRGHEAVSAAGTSTPDFKDICEM